MYRRCLPVLSTAIPVRTREQWIRYAYTSGALSWKEAMALSSEHPPMLKCWQCDELANVSIGFKFYCSSHAPSLQNKDTPNE